MGEATERRLSDSSLVLRTLTVILLSGGSLLAAMRDPQAMLTSNYLVGLGMLWGALALEFVPARGWLSQRRLDAMLVTVDIAAVALVVAAVPDMPGVSVFFLGPVATAAVRLGREGATATAALAALCLLLPAVISSGGVGPVSATTAVGAVLLLTAGLAAGELVRLADRRRHADLGAREQARRVGHELRMILDNLGSGLLSVDAEGCITRLNPAASSILGLGDRTSGRLSLEELLQERCAELTAIIREALDDGEPRKRAEITVTRDGHPIPLGVNIDFLDGEDGNLAGAVVIFSDLTEVRRLRDHLRRADRLAGVGELAASIAHELRNPLASIRGSVELLASELEVHDQHAQLMQLIQRESNRLNTIITDFLSFARMRPTHPEPVELDRFLTDVELQLRQHAAADGGQVTVTCTRAAAGLSLLADPEQLLQAILNLAINACEAMHGEGRLELKARGIDGDCELALVDSGPGIEPEHLEDIFTPFVTTKPNGTGLGLPMVARIVHGHGGTVEAENRPGGGAEFTLRLPLASVDEVPNDVAYAAATAGVADGPMLIRERSREVAFS